MILEIFKDAFEYSSKDYESILKLGTLLLLSPLIIPIFLFSGYSYRITSIGLKGMINGDDPLPRFLNFKEMLVEGFKLFLVQFIYGLPGTIALILIFAFNQIEFSSITSPYLLSILWGFIAIVIAIWLICYLFAIVATTHMIENNGSLKSAFKFKEIINIIKSIGLRKYLEFYIGYLTIIIGILTISFLLILLLTSIVGMLAMYIFNSYDVGIISILLAIFIFLILAIFYIFPFFKIFESRSIALIYNMREINE